MRKKPSSTKPKRRKQKLPWRWQARVIAHSPSFRLLAHRASRAIARSRYAAEDQAWVDAMTSCDDAGIEFGRASALNSIADLIGSVDSLPADLSQRKKHYLKVGPP